MSIKNLIVSEINKNGPITVSQFMNHCLYNKKFGYYTTKSQPIGTVGDFITSPEISQVFGELVGLWLVQTWIDRGRPSPFSLIELGPGNGTMMLDILNTTKKISNFIEPASIILVENSDTLKARQKRILRDYHPIWIDNILDIPEQPLFLIANEFLDALPIRQFKKDNNIWHERYVALSDNHELHFMYAPSDFNKELNVLYRGVPNNTIVETSDITQTILSDLSKKILRNGGVCLFIDYGYFEGVGETLQAVHQHAYAHPLANLGKTDLTAQVNFKNVFNLFKRKGLRATNLENQGNFLLRLGIQQRAEVLAKNLPETKKKLHFDAIDRLIKNDQMGALFKVMGVTNEGTPALPFLE